MAKDGEPLIVHRNGEKPSVVVIPLDDYRELDATDYLMSSEANRRRIEEAIADAKAGRFAAVLDELIE